jgi:hypothetical protein
MDANRRNLFDNMIHGLLRKEYFYSNTFTTRFCVVCCAEATGVLLKCCSEKQFVCFACFKEMMKRNMDSREREIFELGLCGLLADHCYLHSGWQAYEIKKLFMMYSVDCPFCRNKVRISNVLHVREELAKSFLLPEKK